VAALAEEDYEQAAAHIHRFLAMDENLLKCTPTQGTNVGVGLEGSLATLHEAVVLKGALLHCMKLKIELKVLLPEGLTRQ